jgi:isoquinoline 1-oxidoreductase beta subunit
MSSNFLMQRRWIVPNWTRRAFITTAAIAGGGVLIGVAVRPGNRAGKLSGLVGGEGGTLVSAYVKIDSDNVVTAIVPGAEMGQGIHSALAQILADELDADWSTLRIEEAPALGEYASYSFGRNYLFKGVDFPDAVVPSVDGAMMKIADSLNLQVTGGSLSVRVNGMLGMRLAGASTKEMLVQAAADAWQVPVEEVVAKNSYLSHPASERSEPYAAFAAAVAQMTPSSTPRMKTPEEYNLVGQHVDRKDIPSKVDGTAMFALDVRRPGMVYATVVRSPVFGGSIANIDDRAARAISGVIDVIEIPRTATEQTIGSFSAGESVAVVADSYWTAQQGLRALKVDWNATEYDEVSSEEIFAQFDRDISAGIERQPDLVQGDTASLFANAAQVIQADYHVPYLAHTCMEPLNATAEFKNGKCEIWIGCQNPLGFRRAVAEALEMDAEDVTLHNHLMGGGFGRKSRADWAIQVAHVAKAVGKPVQLIWSREEDVRQDFYRPAIQSRFRAALDTEGQLIGWENTYVNKEEPAEAPLIPYAVASQDIGHVSSPTHVPFGAWRSVDHSQHGFFTESFIDEAAIAAGKDPFEFRAALLKDQPRQLAVLTRAAQEAGWHKALPKGRGRGISLQESFGSIVAQVVEVTVVEGQVSVDRIVAVIDAGTAISPDGVAAQLESGIVYGLTAALYGEITIEKGAVVQSNFHDYESLRMAQAPKIETHIINSGSDVGGAGEPGTPGVAPALANAVFNATGTRVRRLPFSRFDLNYQIKETNAVG